MTSLQEVRRVVQARLDKFQPAQRSWDAYLGDGNGTINDESQPFHTYVRYPAANSPATSITNTRVPAQIENLRIKVGYLPEQPTLLQVLSVVPDQRLDDAGSLALLPTHAPTHTYGGSDPVYVVWRQIGDFRLYATGGLQVTLQGGIATIAGTVTTISTQLVDLTDSVPATGARWSLISIKSTGAVTVTDGTPQTTATALTFAHIPATPSGEWRIWAIKLQASQTVIDESRLFVDTLDLRWPQNVGAGSVALSDLAAGSAQYQYLTTGATPFTPAWSSGYLNITAAKTLSATGTLTLTPSSDGLTLTVPTTGTALLRDANVAAGRVAFGSDANTVSGDAQLTWDSTNKRLGVGVLSPEVDFEVAKDDVSIFFLKSFHASAFPIITGFRARGTHTAPTATLTGDQFLQLGGAGYGSTAFPYANASELWFEAAEDWSDTNQGSLLRLRTTPIGSTVASQRDGILIDGYSNVTVPNGNLFVSVGRVGIGSTSINNTAVMINKTFTATDATFASILNAGGVITSASGQNVWGFIAQPLAIMTDPTASTIFGSFLVSETLTKPTVGQTLGTYAGLYLTIPATTGAGTGTITKAATMFIAGPPTAGVTNLSLDVESGVSYFGGKVGLGTTNPQGTLEISKTGADPANSGSTQNSYIRFQYAGGIVGGDIGVAGSAPWGLWIQSRFSNDFSQNNALSLNPNGGNVSIGTMQRGAGVTYQPLSVKGSALFVGTSSVQEREMMALTQSFVVSTDASRTTRTVWNQYDTAAREIMRGESSGSAPLIGFLGANAIARYSSTGDLRQALIDFGFVNTGGASPLDLNGGRVTGFVSSLASTTASASIKIPAGTAPTSPVEGDYWNDSTQKANIAFVDGIKQSRVGCIFTQTADVTVASTSSETTLIGTGVGTVTLPANFFTVGKTIRIGANGHYSTANPAGTLQVKVKLGTTVILDTTASTMSNGLSNLGWTISETVITCRTTGATGTVMGQGYTEFSTTHTATTIDDFTPNTTAVTIDTTTAQAISITAQWGTSSASNTITATNVTVEVLN